MGHHCEPISVPGLCLCHNGGTSPGTHYFWIILVPDSPNIETIRIVGLYCCVTKRLRLEPVTVILLDCYCYRRTLPETYHYSRIVTFVNDHLQLYLLTYSVALVRKRTIPTERPPLVGEVSANFCG
jgi:hypothetical protein